VQVSDAINEFVDANEQVQTWGATNQPNVVVEEHQQTNVLTIEEQIEQSFVVFIPPAHQH
jgi:hypothetical protein